MALDKIHMVVSPLTGQVKIARFGKDPSVALEVRDSTDRFLHCLVEYLLGDRPVIGDGKEMTFNDGEKQFRVIMTVEAMPTQKGTPND